MAKKRAKIFESRYFGLVIGALIIGLFLLMDVSTNFFEQMNTKTVDLHFILKSLATATSIQEGVSVTANNPKISEDIAIVGIDSRSLARFGKWPFPRSIHANLIDSFSRIKDQNDRESALFLDVFIIEPDRRPSDDARFVKSIEDSKHVFMETVLEVGISDYESFPRMLARQKTLFGKADTFTKVSGEWQKVPEFLGVQAPLIPYAKAVSGYGHANYTQDSDEIYRRQALIAKLSVEIEQIRLDTIKENFSVSISQFERLAWTDRQGAIHNIKTPLNNDDITKLAVLMKKSAPPVIVDADSNGVPEDEYFIVRKFQDYFVPSITLSLALNYFGVSPKDVEIELGKNIIIPNPTKFDRQTGKRVPYTIVQGKDDYDKDGKLVKEAPRKTMDKVTIPINQNGEMLINFMGYRSSSSVDGYQTFPVRSYAGYADRVPGPDPETWPKTKAVGGKILMVGPFADGIAQDEKPTPFGLMYGIEIHTNALNTILMSNFLHTAPFWLNAIILIVLVLAISFLTARFSTLWAFLTIIVSVIVLFFALTFTFENNSLILDFTKPAIGMVLSFIAIVSYRAMTEERDKKMIRATFGKYVSPKVVDQILEQPPELGGVDKELTVLFSDIRGFTTLSENMTPQELVNHLNLYLTAMTDLILEYGGTLDKYVGDEIMCFWGAPLPLQDHAILACKCAIRQMQKLHELNEGWPESKRINIGIGLNSGIMTVGNMGSPGRMNYTLMGDNVNLGARLEGTNKQYGTNIIISEFTYGLVKDYFLVRELDNIRVKGKNKPVLIYELVDCIGSIDPPPLAKGEKR
ncbi:MAG: adenylate/guanylate cyclase domain-containing protein [Treponemataceae bacterium]